MNMIVKTAVAGALALSASSAFAAFALPSSGASDLVLVVQNNSTQATYVLDTDISLSSVFPGTGSYVSGASLNTSLAGINATIPESSTLSTFLSSSAPTGFSWGIDGATIVTTTGTATTSKNRTAGLLDGVFTSAGATTTPSNFAQFTLSDAVSYVNGVQQESNGQVATGGAFTPLLTATESATGPVYDSGAQTKYGNFEVNDLLALGTASSLFGITGNGANGVAQTYVLGSAVLSSAGVLTITGNTVSSVPLPAAVWLFGSGLLGLVGVSRRRKAAAVAV